MTEHPTRELERQTRKERIDPRLDAAGWRPRGKGPVPIDRAYRAEEVETEEGPADYVLFAGGKPLAVVEAKKLSLAPQSVLSQAERYARALPGTPFNFDGFRVPFAYSTNGEGIWFRDLRDPRNLSRPVAHFHTPAALLEMLERDVEGACARLLARPNDHPRLRPYQREANDAIEKAIAAGKRRLLAAMATGTGKTFMAVNQVYRLMESGVARRILFLVDRRSLAAQAARAFASFDAGDNLKFGEVYEVFSQQFQAEELEGGGEFNPGVLPRGYLVQPSAKHAFVYVCTIQRMAVNLLGRAAAGYGSEDEPEDEEEQIPDIPVHAFDLVIADECHRGYTSQQVSVWRQVLEHFDAIKLGLTATPAAHTTGYFHEVAYRYEYERAVSEGYLVDWDQVNLRSDVRMQGVFLREGDEVRVVDPASGTERMDLLEEQRDYDTSEVELRVTAPDSNRRILEEVGRHALEHEARYGRFPKTLIFAAQDLPHRSHADQLVKLGREVFGRGEAFVQKITGRVDRPLRRIKEFRNRREPGVVVTVEMLSTGVDIPDLEFIVLLRPVKSRILLEQMLGRGTRKGEQFPDKSHFTVFDCFDGTLLRYFEGATAVTGELPAPPSRPVAEVIEDIWANRDRDYNVRVLSKRLRRVDKEMSGEARELFARWIAGGEVGTFAGELPERLRRDFAGTMTVLRDTEFQRMLADYPRAVRPFVVAEQYPDRVSSARLIRDPAGRTFRPEDYLAAFARFVRENRDHVDAVQILLARPREWSPQALAELKARLSKAPEHFTVDKLRFAHEQAHRKPLVDLISMVKHAAAEEEPLLTAEERVGRALARITAGRDLSDAQHGWLERIRAHLVANLSIDRVDFEVTPVLADAGGWGAANRTFEGALDGLLHQINTAMAA